jgi:hypothetical protein
MSHVNVDAVKFFVFMLVTLPTFIGTFFVGDITHGKPFSKMCMLQLNILLCSLQFLFIFRKILISISRNFSKHNGTQSINTKNSKTVYRALSWDSSVYRLSRTCVSVLYFSSCYFQMAAFQKFYSPYKLSASRCYNSYDLLSKCINKTCVHACSLHSEVFACAVPIAHQTSVKLLIMCLHKLPSTIFKHSY